jgi:predicted TIM-barrel fold metal-dependent hydrolase
MPADDWTRREVLGTFAGLAGARATLPRDGGQVKWSAGTAPPKLKAPPNATDCHHHIYDARYPVDLRATLKPGDASVDDYRALQKRIGTTRNVIVQPSTYGTDNRCTLAAVAAFGSSARAVVVVDDTVTDAELKRLDGLGARGIRFNLSQAGATTPQMIEPLSKRVHDLGWHIQINAPAGAVLALMPVFERVPTPVVFDHLAQIPQPDGVTHPLFARVAALAQKGRAWIKLSGPYGTTRIGPPAYADASAVAREYARMAPERVVWGSDWPHPTEQSKALPDDAALFDLLLDWAPGEGLRRRILVENPAVLYRFE